MMVTRRRVLGVGGYLAAALLGPATAFGAEPAEVVMQGTPSGSHVWFDPVGLLVQRGQTVRWTNRDAGNSHTVTAYHPSVFERPRRIPEGAAPWDSGYLLPGETFSVTFEVEGVYDYCCVPHEHAGMVGRIVVGTPAGEPEQPAADPALAALPEVALMSFPPVAEILAAGVVHRSRQ